jgi:uncharacterized protein involved in exopolysaccharide biosynthesis
MAAVARIVRNEWPVFVAAVVACVVVAGAWAYATKPGVTYVATGSVRVASNATYLVNAPLPDAVIDAVGQPGVLDLAAKQAGVTAAHLGAVSSAAVDGKVRTIVRITVSDKDKETARKEAAALATAARDQVMTPLEPIVAASEKKAAAADAAIAELEKRIVALDADAAASSGVARDAAAAAAVAARTTLYAQQQITLDAQQQSAVTSAYASVIGDPVVATSSGSRFVIDGAARGAFIGLLAGIALALLRDRLRRGRSAAA